MKPPRPNRRPLTTDDVQRLAEQLQRPLPPLVVKPATHYRIEPRPSAASLIDGAPEPPEATVEQVAQQLASDENAWFTRHLVESLQLAGEPATFENLADYGPRLSMRRYPDGTVVVALDSEQVGEGQRVMLGRQLFGFGEPTVEVDVPAAPGATGYGGLLITRSLMSGHQALAYELGLNQYPASAFAFGIDDEPAGIDERLQQLYGRAWLADWQG